MLTTAGLKGARLGVLRQAYDTPTLDDEVRALFERTFGELRKLGAEIINPAGIEDFDAIRRAPRGTCNQFKHDLNNYLGGLRGRARRIRAGHSSPARTCAQTKPAVIRPSTNRPIPKC